MTEDRPKIRLFVDAPLGPGETLVLTEQAHYLTGVMRQAAGAEIALFNGSDGEWAARIENPGKRRVEVAVLRQSAPQQTPPDLWLLFAPIKKARTDFIVEKAAELGAARVQPVLTRFTNAERVRVDRLAAHAREAAEQCGGTFVPEVAEPVKFTALLANWPEGRKLLFCDEAQVGPSQAVTALRAAGPGPWAILIGPEGGFAAEERAALAGMAQAVPVSLGPRILRADTAAVAAITLWQATLGDW